MAFDFKQAGAKIEEAIKQLKLGDQPNELYDPLYYILSIGGKRTRPALTLMGCYLYDENYDKAILPAIGVETFHNFTLIHDDIMDKAPLRRGQVTVHEKWNDNVAILSGDVLMVRAYELISEVDDSMLRSALQLFSTCAADVCEGQQFDMNFEERDCVEIHEYLEMIRLKTAVLLGFALQLGALIGGASEKDADLIRQFGEHLGVGFQLKDDLLDVYGDQAKFGKQVGGDIITNKKTFLLIRALEKAEGKYAEELRHWVNKEQFDDVEKVKAVTAIYDQLGIKEETIKAMDAEFDKGFDLLVQLDLPEEKKNILRAFGENLKAREN